MAKIEHAKAAYKKVSQQIGKSSNLEEAICAVGKLLLI